MCIDTLMGLNLVKDTKKKINIYYKCRFAFELVDQNNNEDSDSCLFSWVDVCAGEYQEDSALYRKYEEHIRVGSDELKSAVDLNMAYYNVKSGAAPFIVRNVLIHFWRAIKETGYFELAQALQLQMMELLQR
jgi:hypothetical protein